MVSPGALKPTDGDGIESRRPLLLSLLCLLYSSHFLIFAPILVCIIIIIIIIILYVSAKFPYISPLANSAEGYAL